MTLFRRGRPFNAPDSYLCVGNPPPSRHEGVRHEYEVSGQTFARHQNVEASVDAITV